MENDDYLEKILGEQYNMSDYFEKMNNNEIDIEQTEVGDDSYNKNKIDNNYDLNNTDENDNDGVEKTKKIEDEETKIKKDITIINKKETKNDENALVKKTTKASSRQIKNENTISKSETATKKEDVIKANSNSINNVDDTNKVKDTSNKNEDKYINALKQLYPDIHKVLEPIVDLLVKNHSDKKVDENLVKDLTDKIYYAVETTNNDDTVKANVVQYAKDEKGIKNGLLYDLIKILIINRILGDKTIRTIAVGDI